MSRIVGAWAGVVAAAVLASSPGQAIAHALVLESESRPGRHPHRAPTHVFLRFNSKLEKRLSHVSLAPEKGKPVALPISVNGQDQPDRIDLPLAPLAPAPTWSATRCSPSTATSRRAYCASPWPSRSSPRLMLRGSATPAGTVAYRAALGGVARNGHFREWRGLALSSVGIGTYLGRDDDVTDALYEAAIERALLSGINVIDSAVNYRRQRSERAVGRALATAVGAGQVAREGVVVATKGGFLPFEGAPLWDCSRPVTSSAAPTASRHGISRTRSSAAGSTWDWKPSTSTISTIPRRSSGEVSRPVFMRRLRAAFEFLEGAARDGRIGVYGTSTWSGYRQPPSARDFLSLPDVVALAEEVGGPEHHFRVVQLPYNLAMTEAFTLPNQLDNREPVATLEAARKLGLYAMTSASIYQGQLVRNLPPVLSEVLPGLDTDAQRALQFVRSTPGWAPPSWA